VSGAGRAAPGRLLLTSAIAFACLSVAACGVTDSSGSLAEPATGGDAAMAKAFAAQAHDVEVQGEAPS
jgi:hypothetical protein